jgi:hypothetical protein
MEAAKLANTTGAVCSGASILGSWQICHTVCLGIVAALSALGITIVGMPLAFLTTYAWPLWIAAAALLVVAGVLAFGFSFTHISRKMLVANGGLLLAGAPFLQSQAPTPWFLGGAIVTGAIIWKLLDRKTKPCCTHAEGQDGG